MAAIDKSSRTVAPAQSSSPTIDLGSMPAGPESKSLNEYLQRIGLAEYAPAFRYHGVTSLKLLGQLGSTAGAGVRQKIADLIRTGWMEGKATHRGSELAAGMVEKIQGEDVQAAIDKDAAHAPSTARDEPSAEERRNRQQQLQSAVDQVRKLREQWAAVANKNDEARRKEVSSALDKLTTQLRAESSLTSFPSAGDLGKDLDAVLNSTEAELMRVSKLTTDAVSKQAMSAVDLIHAHQLLSGRCVDAHGTTEAPGGPVLAMPLRCGDADLFGPSLETLDFSLKRNSESSMARSERLIETHASSFAMATEFSGAAFMGSGIGAMSLAAEYAQAQESRSDAGHKEATRNATHVESRYHWRPVKQIVFATNEFRLSTEALAALRPLLGLQGPALRLAALRFMQRYGTHVFGRIALGGWYRYTASATAKDGRSEQMLEQAVAQAMNWAVSASVSYIGAGGMGFGTASTTGSSNQAVVSGSEVRNTVSDQEVTIRTSTFGGLDGLSREDWIGSLNYPAQWGVIQREAPLPLWTLVEETDPARLATSAARLGELAAEFEACWVQEVFARSLDPELAKAIRAADGPTTVADLERFLTERKQAVVQARDAVLTWGVPTVDPHLLDARRACTAPVALVHRNALHVFAAEYARDPRVQGQLKLLALAFDGARWRAASGERGSQVRANGGWSGLVTDLQLSHDHLWTRVRDIAVVEVGPDGRLLVCSPYEDGSHYVMQLFLFDPPNLYYMPGLPTIPATAYLRPAMARFNGQVQLLYVMPDGHLARTTVPERPDSTETLSVPAGTSLGADAVLRTDAGLAAAEFDGQLCCVYREAGTHRLRCTSSRDGVLWGTPTVLPGDGSEDGASLAVFRTPKGPRLYCAYPGAGGDQPLYLTSTADGVTWEPPSKIGESHGSTTPALVSFSDASGSRLYCVYAGQLLKAPLADAVPLRVLVGTFS